MVTGMRPRTVIAAAALAAALAASAASEATAAPQPNMFTAYITGYSYWETTRPGRADISNPVLHKQAGGQIPTWTR